MNQFDTREAIAPCGLSCEKCLARRDGEIARASAHLMHLLRGFERHAGRFAAMDPVFADYPAFKAVADHLAAGRCRGCRSGECLHAACRVQKCVVDHGVDWCFQCAKYPCEDHGFDPRLAAIWRSANDRMRGAGSEAFRAETRDDPRY